MTDDVFEKGMALRRAVLGDKHVDQAEAKKNEFTEEFQEFITRYAWGEIWTRPGLDRKTRSCITLAMMVALHRQLYAFFHNPNIYLSHHQMEIHPLLLFFFLISSSFRLD